MEHTRSAEVEILIGQLFTAVHRDDLGEIIRLRQEILDIIISVERAYNECLDRERLNDPV